MIIKALSAGVFENILNSYLALDEDHISLLQPMAGKVIAICVEPFKDTWYLCPSDKRIQILENYLGNVDVTISGSLPALSLMGLRADSLRSVFNGNVRIEGDTHTGHQFQTLFKKLDIDLEEYLSRFTGDIFAHQMGNLFRFGQQWSKQSLETFRLNSQEFLQDESRDLPSQPEADIFYRHVDEIRSDFDRLQARINRLEKAHEKRTDDTVTH